LPQNYYWNGFCLQRLFSTFPGGWPGFGLLLLRCDAACALISFGVADIAGPVSEPNTIVCDLFGAAAAIFLLAGLWAPLAGALLALDQLWVAFSLYGTPRDGHGIHLSLAILCAGVAMIGPGAWSIDARLFGRRRVDITAGPRGIPRHP
jgi:putative oxidoreductase